MTGADSNHVTARPGLASQFGWISYEIAGGPYFNIIKIFVFAPFFAGAIVGDQIRGQEYWGYIETASGLCIALLAPFIGSMVDAYGARKPGIGVFSVIAAIGMAALWFAVPGAPILPIAAILVATAVSAEFAYLYHNSLLPMVAEQNRMGAISGAGYSGGYLGTLLVFIPWLALIGNVDVPAFGLSAERGEDVRIVGPIAGLWFVIFAAPLFLFTRDAPRTGLSSAAAMTLGLKRLAHTVSKAWHYGNIVRYLIARMIYYDGLVAIFTFIGIFAAGIFGWSTGAVGLFGLVIYSILLFAGVIGGWVDDRIGSRATILIGLVGVAVCLIASLGITPDRLTYGVPYDASEGRMLAVVGPFFASLGFETLPEQLFIVLAVASGVFMAPTLASSRTMLARLAPIDMTAEFFGLYTLTGKATSFIAPAAIALTTRITQDQRTGLGIVLAFLAAGFIGMLTVREERAVSHLET